MTFYREINPRGEPADLGLDETGQRVMVVVNIDVVKEQSATFEEEIVKLLEDAGVGTRNVDIFVSSQSELPDGDGPFLHLTSSGGPPPLRKQNQVATPAYPRPSMKIIAYGVTYAAARTLARSAYVALSGVRNQDLAP